MRTVKRKALPLNTKKQKALENLCQAYSCEKQAWLQYFQSWESQSYLNRPRILRDEMIKKGYRSPNELQARHWKLALEDAAETWDKYWQSIFIKIRQKISRRKNLSEIERHYAYWLLAGYSQFSALMQGKYPKPSFTIEDHPRKTIADYVHRITRQCKGKPPAVKKARSVRFDANCYDVFEYKGRQYIKFMSLVPGKRICAPLSGRTSVTGTITLVWSDGSIHFHIPQKIKKKKRLKTSSEAVDFGYSEVMTDTQGIRYGTQFGTILTQVSENRHQKMQKRHQLYAMEMEKKKRTSNPQKAKRLRKYNLGKQKHHATAKRFRATLEKEINTSINQIIQTKNLSILITEDLRHTFKYDKSKQMNRRFSSWLRGKLQDRIAFKALAEGFRHEQVNPAYGSQSCPYCEFVDHRNRNGDRFQCLYCKHEDMSDRIAALNYARRMDDPEIGLYTPYRQVKTILLDRFHRRLETGQPVTVPGRTLETVVGTHPPPLSRHFVTAGREISQTGRSLGERN